MPFRLRLTYTGLCFFVKDHGQAVHVLLPTTDGHQHHPGAGDERHYARISYDTAHLRPGQLVQDGVLDHRPFDNVALDLSAFKNTGVGLTPLPPEIPDIGKAAGKKIAAKLHQSMSPNATVPPNGPKRLLSRVTMRAGSIICTEPGVNCTFDSAPTTLVRITNRAVWAINDIPDQSLTWTLAGLDGGPSLTPAPLHPIPKNNASGVTVPTIDLFIYNVIASELPPATPAPATPTIGDEATHFAHYYTLYNNLAPTELPKFFAFAGGAGCSDTSFSAPGVVPFTCMLGGGDTWP